MEDRGGGGGREGREGGRETDAVRPARAARTDVRKHSGLGWRHRRRTARKQYCCAQAPWQLWQILPFQIELSALRRRRPHPRSLGGGRGAKVDRRDGPGSRGRGRSASSKRPVECDAGRRTAIRGLLRLLLQERLLTGRPSRPTRRRGCWSPASRPSPSARPCRGRRSLDPPGRTARPSGQMPP